MHFDACATEIDEVIVTVPRSFLTTSAPATIPKDLKLCTFIQYGALVEIGAYVRQQSNTSKANHMKESQVSNTPPHCLSVVSTVLILIFSWTSLNAQLGDRLSFETAYAVKFSLGEEIRETIEYAPGFTINYPKTSTTLNPIHSMEFTSLYGVSNSVSVGISAGIAFTLHERNPLVANSNFNRVIVPINSHFRYSYKISDNVEISPEFKIGYQFTDAKFGNTADGFLYTQSGGLSTGGIFRISKQLGKYHPSLGIGYELNRIKNDVSLGWVEGYEFDDRYQFSSNYHLLSLVLAMKF
jgi:hypothetical protein